MNCIQPIAPAEETLRLVPKAVSISLIAGEHRGALRAEAVGRRRPAGRSGSGPGGRRRRRSSSSGSRGFRRVRRAGGSGASSPPASVSASGSSSGFFFRAVSAPSRGAAAALRLRCRRGLGRCGERSVASSTPDADGDVDVATRPRRQGTASVAGAVVELAAGSAGAGHGRQFGGERRARREQSRQRPPARISPAADSSAEHVRHQPSAFSRFELDSLPPFRRPAFSACRVRSSLVTPTRSSETLRV